MQIRIQHNIKNKAQYKILVCSFLVALTLGGCANMNETQKGTAKGAGIGAIGGAVIGALASGTKGSVIGAAVGGTAGGVAGNIWSKRMQEQKNKWKKPQRVQELV